jgi:hypothetical protein
MTAPCQCVAPAPGGVMLNLDLLTGFVRQVQDLRDLQRHYRRTIDSVTRRKMEAAEVELDSICARLAAELRAVAAEFAREGGVE